MRNFSSTSKTNEKRLPTNILRNENNEMVNDTKEVMQGWKQLFENLLNVDAVTKNTKKVYQKAEEYIPEPR